MSKRILLPGHYARAGDTRAIAPGEYDIDAPALHGWGGYLVKTGHATVIPVVEPPQAETPPVVEPPSAETEPAFDPHAATMFELATMLASLGVDLNTIEGSGKDGNLLKADLVAAYEQHAAGQVDDEDAPDAEV